MGFPASFFLRSTIAQDVASIADNVDGGICVDGTNEEQDDLEIQDTFCRYTTSDAAIITM